jgi:hypothetical protein
VVTSKVMEIEEEGKMSQLEFNAADYDYMDKMPLEGWIWEIVRRGESYKHEYEKIEKAAEESKAKIDKLLSSFQSGVSKMGIDFHLKCAERRTFNPDYFLLIECEASLFIGIPKPQSKYICLNAETQIKQIKPWNIINLAEEAVGLTYRMFEKSHIAENWRAVISSTTESSMNDEKLPFTRREIITTMYLLNHLLYGLAAPTPEDTVYVGISKGAKDEDIDKLIRTVKKYLKSNKPRVRDEKWKYYLICYDLRKKGLAYKQIEDILIRSYPKYENSFRERTIQNHNANALKLIQGDYKKYIFPSVK